MADIPFPSPGAFPPARASLVRAAGRGDGETRRQAFARPGRGVLASRVQVPPPGIGGPIPRKRKTSPRASSRAPTEKRFFDRFDAARARFRTSSPHVPRRLRGQRAPGGDAPQARRRRGRPVPGRRGRGASSWPARRSPPRKTWRPGSTANGCAALFRGRWPRWRRAAASRAARPPSPCSGATTSKAKTASGRPTTALGRELGLPVTQVTNHLSAMRRELRARRTGRCARSPPATRSSRRRRATSGRGHAVSLSDAALARLAEIVDAPDLAGTKYELRGRVGRGGMGTVWRAHDREARRARSRSR